MMHVIALILSCFLMESQVLFEDENARLQRVYDAVVGADGRVDYARLKNDQNLRQQLDLFVDRLNDVNLMDLNGKEEKMAFFANAYNAITLKGVVDAWPVASVRDIKALFGFFTERKWMVGGRKHSLNQIEKQWLRNLDPGIHFLINCASESCPRLSTTVFSPQNVSGQMEQLAREFILDPQHNSFDQNGIWQLSKIFDWYQKDFGGRDGVIAMIRKHLPDVSDPRKIEYRKYDWALNGPTQ